VTPRPYQRRKTDKMLRAETKIGGPLETHLAPFITEHGFTTTAERLNVSKGTLGYWMLKHGIELTYVALNPDDTLEIKRGHENE
jgi:hypothetical protein